MRYLILALCLMIAPFAHADEFDEISVGIATANFEGQFHDSSATGQPRMQYTNGTTGSGANDGFQVGLNDDGTGIIRQKENLNITIWGNDTQWWTLTPDGKFGFRNGVPTYDIDLIGDIRVNGDFISDDTLFTFIDVDSTTSNNMMSLTNNNGSIHVGSGFFSSISAQRIVSRNSADNDFENLFLDGGAVGLLIDGSVVMLVNGSSQIDVGGADLTTGSNAGSALCTDSNDRICACGSCS